MRRFKRPTKEKLIERWENVLRVLQDLTPHQRKKHWDMSKYGYTTECGTVACAAGHCGLDSWFRRRGFKLRLLHIEGRPYDTNLNNSGILDGISVSSFFGTKGCQEILYNSDARSVSVVIKEVKAHIKWLKGDCDWDDAWP